MPALNGIAVLLESQFDVETIPEEVEPVKDTTDAPPKHEVDVYIPCYLASQFWISYAIDPSALSQGPAPTKFVYFKLILDGKCIVSWAVGESENWKGKTMWAFFRGDDHGIGWRTVEKRSFFFRTTDEEQHFEILAYRARGRRRASRQFEDIPSPGDKGFDLVNWGRLKEHHPQRFYQYALIDPVDQPYAVFRYHVRPQSPGRPDTRSASSNSYFSASEEPSSLFEEASDASRIRRLSYPPTIRLVPTPTDMEVNSPVKVDAEHLSVELDTTKKDEDASSINTVIQRQPDPRTPSPFVADQGKVFDSPPSSIRKRSVSGLRNLFGSLKRRTGNNMIAVRPGSAASAASSRRSVSSFRSQ